MRPAPAGGAMGDGIIVAGIAYPLLLWIGRTNGEERTIDAVGLLP